MVYRYGKQGVLVRLIDACPCGESLTLETADTAYNKTVQDAVNAWRFDHAAGCKFMQNWVDTVKKSGLQPVKIFPDTSLTPSLLLDELFRRRVSARTIGKLERHFDVFEEAFDETGVSLRDVYGWAEQTSWGLPIVPGFGLVAANEILDKLSDAGEAS